MSMTWHCKWCGGEDKHDRRVCRMRAKWQDAYFRERHAEAVRAMLADRWQDADFRERNAEATRALHGGKLADLTDYGRHEYDPARDEGFGHGGAMEIALDAMARAKDRAA
jgi:hypothetical protein